MKTELGQVYYLTTCLTFPHDKDQWIKQEPVPGSSAQSIGLFIDGLNVPDTAKSDLCRKLETSWKDHNGVWVELKIERTRRNPKWGNIGLGR